MKERNERCKERDGLEEERQQSENRVEGKWENGDRERKWKGETGKKKSNEFEKKKWLKKRKSVCVSVFLPAGVQRLVSTLLQHYCIINQVLFSYPLLFRYSVLLFRHCFSYGPYFFSIALSLTDAHITGFALPLLRSSISTLCELPFMQWSHTVYCQCFLFILFNHQSFVLPFSFIFVAEAAQIPLNVFFTLYAACSAQGRP